MDISMVVTDFRTEGGIERAAVELTRSLSRLGHHLQVFASSFSVPEPEGTRYVRVPVLAATTSTKLVSFRFACGRALAARRARLVHAHGTVVGRADIVTAQSCHRAGLDIRKRSGGGLPTHRNLHIADRIMLANERAAFRKGAFRKIIAVSRGLRKELCGYYNLDERDIAVIPNGVNLEEFRPASPDERAEIRNDLGLSRDELVLIFVGNEFDRKGLDILIQALSMLRGEPVHLIVAGRDRTAPYRALAARLGVSEKVRFAGARSAPAPLYRAADLFVLPTLHEAFSLATVEASACGLPLLVTRVNGTEELVRDGVNGLFIDRSAEDAAAKISRLAGSADERRRMGLEAAAAARGYAWDDLALRTLDVYREAM